MRLRSRNEGDPRLRGMERDREECLDEGDRECDLDVVFDDFDPERLVLECATDSSEFDLVRRRE